ncbi:hypothetical protein BD289DRAFT_447055 [Coniella lustricola]|uniref:Secreted protein n=1 Tax=Coniella lustricola TaxID=2025994 RepID=A0A2T2ZTE8_9PEZI|nr:hypothetical protein BD289DRAFT_447055 [Coniella lustricola]
MPQQRLCLFLAYSFSPRVFGAVWNHKVNRPGSFRYPTLAQRNTMNLVDQVLTVPVYALSMTSDQEQETGTSLAHGHPATQLKSVHPATGPGRPKIEDHLHQVEYLLLVQWTVPVYRWPSRSLILIACNGLPTYRLPC